jgi:hydroxymethylpyrimidine/phosphomethylpyrimidine kinase
MRRHGRFVLRPVVLSIGGLDPGGGAGILADVKTIEAHGCWATAVATTLTAQTVAKVGALHGVPPRFLRQQIESVFDDHAVAAVKLGLLGAASTVGEVALALRSRAVPIVLDPVCASSSGTRFLDDRALEQMREELLPIVSVVTPNREEARILGGEPVPAQALEGALRLRDFGAEHVLVTSFACENEVCEDVLFCAEGRHTIAHRHIETDRLHGTGCLHSSSLAARLAGGASMLEAATGAGRWVQRAIEHGRAFGAGGSPDASWGAIEPRATLREGRS